MKGLPQVDCCYINYPLDVFDEYPSRIQGRQIADWGSARGDALA
jgi:hypothetical protein